MDIRSNESPMDFQWQKGHGPAGSDSPFLKAAANHHQHQTGFTGQRRESRNLREVPQYGARASAADMLAFTQFHPIKINLLRNPLNHSNFRPLHP